MNRAVQQIRTPCSAAIAALIGFSAISDACFGQHSEEPAIAPSTAPAQWLTDVTDQVGLAFTHQTGATGEFLLPEIMGAGGALFDYDNDGDLDIVLVNGSDTAASDQRAGTVRDALFRQDPGFRFTNVTEQSGLGDVGYGMGVAIGDIDNDGDLDVFITNYGPDQLYRNRGDGTFENITDAAQILVDGWSASATFLDYDRDGFLDLYITRYLHHDPAKRCFDALGRPDYCAPKAFAPQTHVLLHNNGDGTFADVSKQSGIGSASGHGLGVVCDDVDGDGWVDIWAANDGDANFLWVNQRDGTFREMGVMLGVAVNLHGKAEAGMGVLAEDFNNDGRNDLFVTHLRSESHRLYMRRSQAPFFDDVTGECGLFAQGTRHTGFGAAALDIDLDGDLDLAIANGGVTRGPVDPGVALPAPWDVYAERNSLFLNDGQGRFQPGGDVVRDFCSVVEISRGLATGDVDNDGDLDLLVTNSQGPARLFRNDAPFIRRGGHWLTVRAIDPRLKRDAIGARVTVQCGERQYTRTISAGFSYLSSSDPRAHFGLGQATAVDRIDVCWPDGLRETFPGVAADQAVTIERGQGTSSP